MAQGELVEDGDREGQCVGAVAVVGCAIEGDRVSIISNSSRLRKHILAWVKENNPNGKSAKF